MILLVIKDCSILPAKQAGSSYHSQWPCKKWNWDTSLCLFIECYHNYYPQLHGNLASEVHKNDNKSIRDLLSKDAFYQATKEVGQTSTALRFVFLLMSPLTPPQCLGISECLLSVSAFKTFPLIQKEKEYILSNNKRRIQKRCTTCVQLQQASTLCWVFKIQFQNLSSKLSCGTATTWTGVSHIKRKEA